jgi:hypothetical protein
MRRNCGVHEGKSFSSPSVALAGGRYVYRHSARFSAVIGPILNDTFVVLIVLVVMCERYFAGDGDGEGSGSLVVLQLSCRYIEEKRA